MKNACEWGPQKAMATTKAIHEFQMNLQHFNNTRSFAHIVRPSLFYLFIYSIN